MMSRPLPSAPKKNLPPAAKYWGPIGTPEKATTLTSLPFSLTVSVRWFENGPVWATLCAHSGARIATRTSRTNRTPNASATLLRRRRRIARTHGPAPAVAPSAAAIASKPPASTAAVSVATRGTIRLVGGCRGTLPPQRAELLQAEQSPVDSLCRVRITRAVLDVHTRRVQ